MADPRSTHLPGGDGAPSATVMPASGWVEIYSQLVELFRGEIDRTDLFRLGLPDEVRRSDGGDVDALAMDLQACVRRLERWRLAAATDTSVSPN